ncbi:DUF429 domain-containing protein [Thauera sp. 2A1]|uniref:DUF429 domain-containing protein n=1 Tax=Thauera sp. 2A1 TaxID=2570191 RepID=UPI001290A473|nr:DUF429 domain-containing protein [Thauera sp. 2A1]KAI5912422.1 DUF429 domain-containing protein [Thauera sp. 2A1]
MSDSSLASGREDWTLIGVDFTSAPRWQKPITAALGRLDGGTLVLQRVEALPDWPSFEALLARPGPWLGAFDFPFGLPREAVVDLGLPQDWPALVRHCAALGREGFRAALDAYRESRPLGRRYAHRATDLPARSHSPLKLVNPPVGLMFLEGAPRLLAAGVTVAGILEADPQRIALEAYPGLLARSITAAPYKSDDKAKQTTARRDSREAIVHALQASDTSSRPTLAGPEALLEQLIYDASGDHLDATLALVQAATALRAGAPNFGLPDKVDRLEGWIAGA